MKVIIIGAGGHGQVVADILLTRQDTEPVGFVDDDASLRGRLIMGLSVLGAIAQLSEFEHEAVVIGIGSNRTRQLLIKRLAAQGETFVSAIHPATVIATQVPVGAGTVICAGVVVNTGTQIGQGVILNTGCTVDHHNRIGDYVHIAPGTHLGGDVTVGEGTLVGIGATVMPQRKIGERSIIGAGAVINHDIPAHVVATGNPARVIRKLK